MKIIEWNIHKMTNDILVKKYVVDVILETNADIIVLTEYMTDSLIENALSENYYFEESNTITGNKVFIAIKKEFAPKGICVKNKDEKQDCYNFLHIDIMMENGEVLSIIGIRMLSPIDASKQTFPLNQYLSKLSNPFLCTGDFNLLRHRVCKWFPGIAMSNIINSEKPLSDSSYVYVNKNTKKINGFGVVDHLLHSEDLAVDSVYDWDYLSEDSIYPCIEDMKIGVTWDIPAAYPDHALMISYVKFSDIG